MLPTGIKLAWRNLVKDKQFSLLNLIGLASGLACVFLIYLWVADERSIDKFNANDDRLYQVLKKGADGAGNIMVTETTPGLLAENLAREMPELSAAVAVIGQNFAGVVSAGEKQLKARVEFASPHFLDVFSYSLLRGSKKGLLQGTTGLLLSRTMAMKLFGDIDVVGRTIRWDYRDNGVDFSNVYEVKAVFADPPANASDQFDVLLPFDLFAFKMRGEMGDVTFWGSNMARTYVLLKPGADPAAFDMKIRDYTKAKLKKLYAGQGLEQYEGDLFLQKYSDKYLHNHYVNGSPSGGRIEYVRLFSIIAIFVLVIACINFMNLSTAKASRRLKEVGIKKVAGASRSSLILQHLSESLLMSVLASLLAVVIIVLLLPQFRALTGKALPVQLTGTNIAFSLVVIAAAGILAGSYPAFYLSSFEPIGILKGRFKSNLAESLIRKGLVVFQFSVSIILIVSVLILHQQMTLIRNTNLGYNRSNLLHFPTTDAIMDHMPSFLSEIRSIPGVVRASDMEGNLLGNYSHAGGGIDWEGKDPNLGIDYYGNSVDNEFFETMGLQLAEGRFFSKKYRDSSSVIFNEAAIKAMGLKNPVGRIVKLWGKPRTIVGVLKNYHFESLYKRIGPAFFDFSDRNPEIIVRINSAGQQQTIASIKAVFSKYTRGLEFSYGFLDADYNKLYASEERVALLSRYFAAMAVVISCLGLFGLAAFTAQKRQKEIGIRKVIGATVSNVVAMLSGEFLVLVGLALLIALPASWWGANLWLQGFAYRTRISPLVFGLTALAVLLITLLTISFQAVRAALTSPVVSLRSE